jgi:methylisocitrate lyase
MTKAETNSKKLRAMLASGKMLVVPGAFDPMSAKLVERAGFPAVYIGSYATAAAGFGMPDVGLVTMEEMAAHAKRIADAVDMPVIADGENGLEQRGEYLAHRPFIRASRRLWNSY